MWVIIARALISWVNPDPYNPIVRFLYNITEPVLAWLRQRLPLVYSGLDLSPLRGAAGHRISEKFSDRQPHRTGLPAPLRTFPAMPTWFSSTPQGYRLRLTVAPGGRRTEVVGLHGDRLKIRLAAVPEKGAANRELLAFLARALRLPEGAFRLLGARSRSKLVEIDDPSPDLLPRLEALLKPVQSSKFKVQS